MNKPAESSMQNSIHKTVEVACSRERAFDVFTRRMATWWPPQYKIGAAPFTEIVVEPKKGGNWYETGQDGVQCQWGSVLAWNAPALVELSWHLGVDYIPDPDPAKASRVVVRFDALGPARTRVRFEHRDIDRHGPGFDRLRTSLDEGWEELLQLFAAQAAAPN